MLKDKRLFERQVMIAILKGIGRIGACLVMLKLISLQLNMTFVNESNILGDVSNYQPNGEFKMEAFIPERHEVYYSCCEEPYIDITYYIQLRRRPMFYVFNLILPCILINGIGK